MSTYTAGQMVRFSVHYTNPESSDARVQTTTTFKVTNPAGTVTSYTGVYDSTNQRYTYDYDTTGLASGTYTLKVEGTDTYLAAAKTTFTIG